MSDEMKNEVEVKEEGVQETMEDYAAELEASYKTLNRRNIEAAEDENGQSEKWAKFAQMKEDHTVVKVKIVEAVKGGVVAYLDDTRAFIPGSHLSSEYVENLEDFKGQTVEVTVITADPENKKLVLSARQVARDRRDAARRERMEQLKAGDVVEGVVDSIKDYGAFVNLGDGLDGLLHVSQISTQRIKHPGAVLKEGQAVTVKIRSVADGKISLTMKDLAAAKEDEEAHNRYDYKETASVTTGLGDLLKGLKL